MTIGHRFAIGSDKHGLWVELSEQEYYAIGCVTVHWAYLEHTLLWRTAELADKAGIPLPEHAKSFAFKKRITAFRTLVKHSVREPRKTRLLSIATRISNLERSRHRITHGLWDWRPEDAEKLVASSFRHGVEFTEPFEFKKLYEVAERISQVIFDLTYPRGKRQALVALVRDFEEHGGLFGRSAALLGQGKGGLDPHRVVPIRVGDTPLPPGVQLWRPPDKK